MIDEQKVPCLKISIPDTELDWTGETWTAPTRPNPRSPPPTGIREVQMGSAGLLLQYPFVTQILFWRTQMLHVVMSEIVNLWCKLRSPFWRWTVLETSQCCSTECFSFELLWIWPIQSSGTMLMLCVMCRAKGWCLWRTPWCLVMNLKSPRNGPDSLHCNDGGRWWCIWTNGAQGWTRPLRSPGLGSV